MADKFVTFDNQRPRTGLPPAVDAKIDGRYATKAELSAAVSGTGGVRSPSVSRIIASSDPDTPLVEGDLLLLYAPPFSHFEDWSDGLTTWENIWTDEAWTVVDGAAQITKTTANRVALAYNSEPLSDVEIVAKITVANVNRLTFCGGLGVRVLEGAETKGYAAILFSDELRLIRYKPGAFDTLAISTEFVPTSGQTFWSRLRIKGGTLSAKMWADGTPEPSEWQATYGGLTDLTAGQVALIPGSEKTITQYLQVGITEVESDTDSAPVVAP